MQQPQKVVNLSTKLQQSIPQVAEVLYCIGIEGQFVCIYFCLHHMTLMVLCPLTVTSCLIDSCLKIVICQQHSLPEQTLA